MEYNRQIGYLDNYCKGLRMSAAGVVRLDCVDEERRLWISAKPAQQCMDSPSVYFTAKEKKYHLGEACVSQGNIVFHLCAKGHEWDAYNGIEIPISENWVIKGTFKELPKEEPLEEVVVAEEPKEINKEDATAETSAMTKWDKLFLQYPKRIPFSDGKKYLELTMSDLTLLSEKQYALTKNPFLVYGFQQYGYLLLGRVGQEKYHSYRLGVPGIFHPKEVQAAMRYGFDSFESDRETPKEGELGVYFTAVNL